MQTAPTTNKLLVAWVDEMRALCQPDDVYWCDGSAEEYQAMADAMVANGTAEWLDGVRKPNSLLSRSDPADAARVEDRTYVCPTHEIDAGPTNNWAQPAEMCRALTDLFDGVMQGRTMYVIPFSMGPIGSHIAHTGVELTDSPYVVASMHIMTRVGQQVLEALGDGRLRALPPLRRNAAGTRRRRRSMAFQQRGQVHRPLPGEPRDLVVRLGLRRQRAARQEVFCSSYCVGDGPRRGLARRAHAHPQTHVTRGNGALRGGRVPERLRQDQPRHDGPDARGLEGRDDRR